MLMDGEMYLLACMRYIELNPVRDGMVSHPGEYRWSTMPSMRMVEWMILYALILFTTE